MPESIEQITEQEFYRLLFDNKNMALEEIGNATLRYNQYIRLIIDTQTYKELGFRVNYFLDTKSGEISYDIQEREIGFQHGK